MPILLDTSLLGRFANTSDAEHLIALDAVTKLEGTGETILITPQNLIEFRSFATRPISQNGLGMSPALAEQESAKYEATYGLLADTPDVFFAWKRIVQTLSVRGKQVHDARLMAVCQVHSIDKLLTFNVGHFVRLATATSPQVAILDPRTV